MGELFTVIVLSYNNSQYLTGCIDSVLKQDYDNIEIVIADDGSKAFLGDELEQYCRENNRGNISSIVVLRSENNVGTVKNINNAVGHSGGVFFKLIGADDALANEHTLTNAAAALRESPDGIITSDVIKCDAEMKSIGKYPDRLQHKLNSISAHQCFTKLCIHNDIIAGGVFFTREFFDSFGPFDEDYKLLEDWPMWLKVTRTGGRIMYHSFSAIRYRADVGFGTSINAVYMSDKKTVLKKEIVAHKKELGWFNYCKARISFALINSAVVRRAYGFVKRRGSAQ